MRSGLETHDTTQFDPRHPRHGEGLREGLMAFGVVAGCAVMFWVSVPAAFISLYWKIFLTLILASGAGFLVSTWIGHMRVRYRQNVEKDYRDTQSAEIERKLAEARARGDFDKWEGQKDQ
ncbi:hypothetical protein [Celeribacter sp.]|uniref:hypothetical protein n=1 Tax=Celeribacter sp. TaxID=1890673 RepID=UPI003A95C9FA